MDLYPELDELVIAGLFVEDVCRYGLDVGTRFSVIDHPLLLELIVNFLEVDLLRIVLEFQGLALRKVFSDVKRRVTSLVLDSLHGLSLILLW